MKVIVDNISKKFGKNIVIKNVSITLGNNKFFGLLGPNGAGKTTLIKIISGQIKPSSGNIKWINDNGEKMTKNERSNVLGFVHQNSVLDEYLNVKENLIFRGALKGISKKNTINIIKRFNYILDIDSISNVPYGKLSGGQKRRVDIIAALIHSPKILILDEPTTGIDPEIRMDLWNSIHKLQKKDNISVILITHYLEEMIDINQLVVLLNGEINFNGSLNKFIDKFSKNYIDLFYDNNKKRIFYNTLTEKINIINKYKDNLIDFDDKHKNLEDAYIALLNSKEMK